MSSDQLDRAEADLFREIAENLHNIDRRSNGGEKTGLHSKHTKELIKKLGSSGIQNSPRRPPSSVPEIPEIPEGAGLEPIQITEDMLKEAQLEEGMDAIKNPKIPETPMEIPEDLVKKVDQLEKLKAEHTTQDPNQLELGFDVVKAEDVYNEISDLTLQIRSLRQELREIKIWLKQSE